MDHSDRAEFSLLGERTLTTEGFEERDGAWRM